MFFQRKYPIIEACSASEKHKVKDWSTSFDEVYLLTHPYYMLHGKEYFFKNYHDVL